MHRIDFGVSRQERSEAGGNAFAAAKLEPDRKQMSEHGKERGSRHDAGADAVRRNAARASKTAARPLARIENEGGDPERRRLARYVGRADVAAAARAHIFALENSHQQIAERDRSQQVADRGDSQCKTSCMFV